MAHSANRAWSRSHAPRASAAGRGSLPQIFATRGSAGACCQASCGTPSSGSLTTNVSSPRSGSGGGGARPSTSMPRSIVPRRLPTATARSARPKGMMTRNAAGWADQASSRSRSKPGSTAPPCDGASRMMTAIPIWSARVSIASRVAAEASAVGPVAAGNPTTATAASCRSTSSPARSACPGTPRGT